MQQQAGACGALYKGVYAVPWGRGADEGPALGMRWRWTSGAIRLDGGAPALWLSRPLARADLRPRARTRLRRLALAPVVDTPAPGDGTEDLPPGGLLLTDGRSLFAARLLPAARGPVLVFAPHLPPPGTDLWITAIDPRPAAPPPAAPGGLLAGTRIATPDGLRPVEGLAAGDRVLTRDGIARPLLWVGQTRLSGAELALHPHLRPVLIRPGALGAGLPAAPLRLAPGHRVARPGAGLRPGGEVLVAAADLIDDGRPACGIGRDLAATSAIYVQLMLPGHALLSLGGVPVESFHPGLADPAALRWHARGIERIAPGLTRDPWRYGEAVLPCLDTVRAALLRAA